MFIAATPPLSAQAVTYSNGLPGVEQTLAIMRAIVREWRASLPIRQAALSAVFLTPEKDDLHEVQTLFELVRDHVRYTRDILDVETISTPDKTLETLQGDCDDQTVLLCSLLEAVGYKTRFVVTAYTIPDHFEHVYAQVFVPQLGEWVNADPTEREPLGYAPPNPLSALVENVT